MNKKEIVIVLNEDDGAIDVEVYEWDTKKEMKGQFMDEESEYGIEDKQEANDFIDRLYEKYEVAKFTSLEEEEEEIETYMNETFAGFQKKTPHYVTFEYERDEFEEYLNFLFYQEYRIKVPLSLESPTESDGQTELYLYLDEKNVDKRHLEYIEHFTDYRKGQYHCFLSDLLNVMFPNTIVHYKNDPYRYKVIIKIPFEEYIKSLTNPSILK